MISICLSRGRLFMDSIHGYGSARSGTLEKQRGICYIRLSGHCFGAQSRGS